MRIDAHGEFGDVNSLHASAPSIALFFIDRLWIPNPPFSLGCWMVVHLMR